MGVFVPTIKIGNTNSAMSKIPSTIPNNGERESSLSSSELS